MLLKVILAISKLSKRDGFFISPFMFVLTERCKANFISIIIALPVLMVSASFNDRNLPSGTFHQNTFIVLAKPLECTKCSTHFVFFVRNNNSFIM